MIQCMFPTKSSGADKIAPRLNIRNMAPVMLTPCVNALLLATAKIEYEVPAPIARRNPRMLKSEMPFEVLNTMIPKVVIKVAMNHRLVGFSRFITKATIPVSAGADPRAVTVPIATPVLFTAEKNVIW